MLVMYKAAVISRSSTSHRPCASSMQSSSVIIPGGSSPLYRHLRLGPAGLLGVDLLQQPYQPFLRYLHRRHSPLAQLRVGSASGHACSSPGTGRPTFSVICPRCAICSIRFSTPRALSGFTRAILATACAPSSSPLRCMLPATCVCIAQHGRKMGRRHAYIVPVPAAAAPAPAWRCAAPPAAAEPPPAPALPPAPSGCLLRPAFMCMLRVNQHASLPCCSRMPEQACAPVDADPHPWARMQPQGRLTWPPYRDMSSCMRCWRMASSSASSACNRGRCRLSWGVLACLAAM